MCEAAAFETANGSRLKIGDGGHLWGHARFKWCVTIYTHGGGHPVSRDEWLSCAGAGDCTCDCTWCVANQHSATCAETTRGSVIWIFRYLRGGYDTSPRCDWKSGG